MQLEQRIARLKALEATRKHRHFNACDLNAVAAIPDCFAGGDVRIDCGPLGCFSNRDSFIELYRSLACRCG